MVQERQVSRSGSPRPCRWPAHPEGQPVDGQPVDGQPADGCLLRRLRRSVVISLKKKTAEWWDGLSKDKGFKRFIKTDFSKWCEEEDKEYTGDMAPIDGMEGMDFGGMGGMPGMGGMGMGGMGDMGDFGDSDDEEDGDEDMSDLQPSDLPPLESGDLGGDGPPPLEGASGGDGPPPLEPDVSKMQEVD